MSLDKALEHEREINAAYMRGYRARKRSNAHEECQQRERDLLSEIAKRDMEIEILNRLVKGA